MKSIAFVGQLHYFDCAIPDKLNGFDKIQKFNINIAFDARERYAYLLDYKDDFDYWVFFRGEFIPKDVLRELKGKKIWIGTEPIKRSDTIPCLQRGHAGWFDYVTHYDKTEKDFVEKLLSYPVHEFQLPVNLNLYKPLDIKKEWDIGFIGRSNDRRERMIGLIKRDRNFLHVAHGLIGEKYVEVINQTKINLNIHIDIYPQLQHRMQNIIASGGFVLSERLSHSDKLVEGEHFVEYTGQQDLMEKIEYYLTNEEEREAIAKKGMEFVRENFDAEKEWLKLLKQVDETAETEEYL